MPFTYSSCFLFLPHAVSSGVFCHLPGCTTSFRLWQRCWCLTTIDAFKTLWEGIGGRLVFLPVALSAFQRKLNVPFPTSAESLSGYVNLVWKGTANSNDTARDSRSHLLCSGFPGPPEPLRLSWFEFELTACSGRSTGRENPVLGTMISQPRDRVEPHGKHQRWAAVILLCTLTPERHGRQSLLLRGSENGSPFPHLALPCVADPLRQTST